MALIMTLVMSQAISIGGWTSSVTPMKRLFCGIYSLRLYLAITWTRRCGIPLFSMAQSPEGSSSGWSITHFSWWWLRWLRRCRLQYYFIFNSGLGSMSLHLASSWYVGPLLCRLLIESHDYHRIDHGLKCLGLHLVWLTTAHLTRHSWCSNRPLRPCC